jgi:hypothetical protein
VERPRYGKIKGWRDKKIQMEINRDRGIGGRVESER